eukprot:365968-Chlamydomonas_euryale.AAC.13
MQDFTPVRAFAVLAPILFFFLGRASVRVTCSTSAPYCIEQDVPSWFFENAVSAIERWDLGSSGVENVRAFSTSQHGEDIHVVSKYFCGLRRGTYLELGALDGIEFSNTLGLELGLGWKGVLLEASLESYEQLQRNRPNATTVHAVVCSQPKEVHYISKGPLGGIIEFMPESFVKRWHPEMTNMGAEERHQHGTPVMCAPLKEILASHSCTKQHYNFWSMRVGGGELEVIKSVDFACFTFDVIAVEADEHNPEKNQAVRELLGKHGYDYVELALRSDWFQKREWQAKPCSVA